MFMTRRVIVEFKKEQFRLVRAKKISLDEALNRIENYQPPVKVVLENGKVLIKESSK